MNKLCLLLAFPAVISLPLTAQVGIGTTTPNSMLDVRGSMSTSYRTFTNATATITSTDNTLAFTGTFGATVTLPTAVGITGRVYWIKNASTTLPTPTVTINTTSSQTIDGASNWVLDEANEVIKVISNGANWYILSQNVAIPGSSTTGGPWLQGGNTLSAVKTLGTTSNFDLPFITNNTEKMRLTTAGYLGLDVAAPLGRLHVVNENNELGDDYIFDDYGTGTQGIYLTKSRGTAALPANLQNGDQIGWLRFIPRYNGSISYNAGTGFEVYYKGDGTTNLEDLRMMTGNIERMRISELGNVAIGAQVWDATNPEKLLVDAGVTTSFNVISGRGNINNYLQLNIQNRSAGTSASSDVVASANNATESANFIDMGINSSAYNYTALPILNGFNTAYLYATGRDFVIGNAASSRNLLFFTNGFATTDEKLRITSAGNVGIGVTNPSDKLSVAGAVVPSADNTYTLGKSGARWSAVWATNGVIQTSDLRLKTDIEPLQYGLKEVLQLRPVSFHWKNEKKGPRKLGLLAQEVQPIIPEVIANDTQNGTLGMNYAELIPVLINAVKEQQQQIDEIQNRITDLKKTLPATASH